MREDEKKAKAIQQWLLGKGVIEEEPVRDEHGRIITVPGCPLCRVSEHYKWASKALVTIFRCL